MLRSLIPSRRASATAQTTPQRAGPAATKASQTAALVALAGLGRAIWTPKDYAALARAGFLSNVIAYRCTRLVAETAAMAPLTLSDAGRSMDTHPLTGLLARPNSGQSGRELLTALHIHLQVAGNAYLEAVSVDDRVVELHALRPDRMRIVPGEDGWPEAYEYTVGAHTKRFAGGPRGAILHVRLLNPVDDHYGASPLEAAAKSVDIHNAIAAWAKSLLDNAARPSGALIYAGMPGAPNLTPEQFERLKTELADNYAGAVNAGRPMLLEGGLDWKPMGFSPSDMEFIEARHAAARDIALAFGVPPMLLGIPGDNTYSNYQEANRAFARQTVLPLIDKIVSALDTWLAPRFGPGIGLAFDRNALPALLPEQDALWSRIGKADFLTVNEKRSALGYPPLADGDVLGNGPRSSAPKS